MLEKNESGLTRSLAMDTVEVSISSVSFAYRAERSANDALPVLSNVSFKASAGSLLAVVGPSGCGKSTLLNLIAGLMQPTSGKIGFPRLLDQSLRRTAYVFQNPRLVPWRTVRQNALIGAELAGDLSDGLRHACDERLAAYGIGGFEDALPHALSGGMQQRVALLRALLSGAKVMLLDEPYVSSDFVLRRQLQTELSEAINRDQLVAILVTHDLTEAVRLADEIVVLSERPAEVVESFRVPIPREHRLSGEPSVMRELADYVSRLECAVAMTRNGGKQPQA